METVVVKTVLEITSPAFTNGGWIPKNYSCEGQGNHPELQVGAIPADAKSLAIIVEDPDASSGVFTHWIAWNIPPSAKIVAGSNPGQDGDNGRGQPGWTPPCPPTGAHRYYFKVYALDTLLDMNKKFDKISLEHEMDGHVIGYGELVGRYEKGRA